MGFFPLGKSKESISQKLDEIIAKQKSLEVKGNANGTSPNPKKRVLKQSQQDVKTKLKKMGTTGKAKHLRTRKQKPLGFQDQTTENISTHQKMTGAKSSQLASPPVSRPTTHLRRRPSSIPVPREKTRPNILSHKKSQTLAQDQGWYYKIERTPPTELSISHT